MRLLPLAITLALLWSGPVVRARQPSPGIANYTLVATLDPVSRTIAGRGRLSWRNTTSAPATELQFHLYWNAWRNDSSTWMGESRLIGAGFNRPAEDRGQIDLTGLSIADGPGGPADLLTDARFIAPDDGNAADRTVLSVPLRTALAPGATVDLDMEWISTIPRTFARTGAIDSYFFIAHWFPKIGVFEDAGWNTHQFHRSTEFFADYGTYDVSMTVPAGWVVAATGREQSRTVNSGGTETHRYVQTGVHDFAWTTSPDFVDVRRRLEAPGMPPVDVRLLLQPGHRDQADRHFDAARHGLSRFTSWFGPYPHGHLTIVDPVAIVNVRAQGESTDGMEYPTLITGGTFWYPAWRDLDPDDVVIHEIGHQFWQGLVGTNEFEHAWMDEGITTFATARVIDEAYPGRFAHVERYFGGLVPWTYTDVPWSRDVEGNRLRAYRAEPGRDALSTPSWRFWPRSGSAVTYAKTALWLMSLERMLGWETVQRGLASAFQKGMFRHPSPDEFLLHLSSAAGRDLDWFFDAVYRSSATFDYAVDRVVSHSGNGTVDSTVILRRLGEGIFPVDVVTTFEDGRSVTARWRGEERWHALQYRREAAVRSVEIDPHRVLTLDLDYTNNSWAREPAGAAASHAWSLRWLLWLETVLLTYAFFA